MSSHSHEDVVGVTVPRPSTFVQRNGCQIIASAIIVATIVVLTYLNPADNPAPFSYISAALGWTYFFAWSVSFYFQVVLNYKRKSTQGLSYDFVWLNNLGFICLSIDYVFYHSAGRNSVHLNDVVFALHAEAISLFTFCQVYFMGYERDATGVSARAMYFVLAVTVLGVAWAVANQFLGPHEAPSKAKPLFFHNLLTWDYLVVFLSYVKLVVSCVKYIPQAFMNWERKSTVGWSIGNVLLDFTGGSLSVAQTLMDAATKHDWSSISGNPVKFGLGFVSIFFDIVFMLQHFVLYPDTESHARLSPIDEEAEYDHLISDEGGDDADYSGEHMLSS